MSHPRTVIRNAVAAALAELLAGKRVWTSRAKPLSEKTVPAVLVYTPNEKLQKGSYGGDEQGPLIRNLTLAVEIVDLADDDDEATLEDRLDRFAELVEAWPSCRPHPLCGHGKRYVRAWSARLRRQAHHL